MAAVEKAIVDALEKKNPILPNPNDRRRRLVTQTQQGQRPAVSKNKQNRKHQNKGRPKQKKATKAKGENNGNQRKKGIITPNQQPQKYCNPLPRKTRITNAIFIVRRRIPIGPIRYCPRGENIVWSNTTDYETLRVLKEKACKTDKCHEGLQHILNRRRGLLERLAAEETSENMK
jgi:hypothetical protein